jgi:ABC-type dipeptide/oligopeptide/nickel transport system permease component
MLTLILGRALQSCVALLVLSVVVFGLSRASGDPVELMVPVDATQEARDVLRQTLGLDRSLSEQYVAFLKGALSGDLGVSIRERRSALELVFERLSNSAWLALSAMSVAIALAVPLAVAAAVWKGTLIDAFARYIAVLGQSLPTFFVGLVLIIVVSGQWGLLPAGGMEGWQSYVLPSITLGWFVVAGMMRLLRSSLLEVLDSEFVKLARIKGVPESVVIWKHALRNALISVVTLGGVYFALLLSTAVIVETVFAWPGLGRLAYDAVRFRDFPVTQAVVLVTAVLVVTTNLIVDFLYAWLDPRIRRSQGAGL